MTANVFGLGEVADFTTNVDAENQTLINHKCVCASLNRNGQGALIRCFCQIRVINSGPFCRIVKSYCFCLIMLLFCLNIKYSFIKCDINVNVKINIKTVASELRLISKIAMLQIIIIH
jgi:hypothetical protein